MNEPKLTSKAVLAIYRKDLHSFKTYDASLYNSLKEKTNTASLKNTKDNLQYVSTSLIRDLNDYNLEINCGDVISDLESIVHFYEEIILILANQFANDPNCKKYMQLIRTMVESLIKTTKQLSKEYHVHTNF